MTMITNIPSSTTTVPIGRKFAAYLGDCINHWLAAWIARREREVARKMLLSFSDRQLRDMGLCRSQIDYALNNPHQSD
jgi:uncharacterized protein YjiS (DUF1127 family)